MAKGFVICQKKKKKWLCLIENVKVMTNLKLMSLQKSLFVLFLNYKHLVYFVKYQTYTVHL